MQIKFLPNASYCQQLHLHRSTARMTSVSETTDNRTHTLRYELRSREIYIEEPITSPEILSEHPQTQDESITTIQETPNSQFRLVLSVTPCMPRISSLESVNDSTSPLQFSSTSSLTFAPTPDSPKDQLPPSPTSSTNILTSFNTCIDTSSQHDKAQSPELFSPTPTNQNKWPSPPPSLNDPHELEEGINYIIMLALRPRIGALKSVVVLVLPHLTPQLLKKAYTHRQEQQKNGLMHISK